MSKPESKNVLSQEGAARKEAMLGQLQDELVSVHQRRQQRKVVAKGVALAAVVVIFGVAWLFLALKSMPGNQIAEANDPGAPAGSRSSLSAVSNVDGIEDRCLVANSDSSAKFETMSDDELLAALSAVGRPSVLGKIKGKVRVIPDAAPKRRQANAL